MDRVIALVQTRQKRYPNVYISYYEIGASDLDVSNNTLFLEHGGPHIPPLRGLSLVLARDKS